MLCRTSGDHDSGRRIPAERDRADGLYDFPSADLPCSGPAKPTGASVAQAVCVKYGSILYKPVFSLDDPDCLHYDRNGDSLPVIPL